MSYTQILLNNSKYKFDRFFFFKGMNRSIIRSTKNVQGQNEGKKVQVTLASNHLSRSDIENSFYDKENSQRSITRRDLSIDGSRKKIDQGKRKGQLAKDFDRKATSLHKSCTAIKGCLKRDFQELKESLNDSDQMAKSTKSIKFNINQNDVFEYTHAGQAQSRKILKTATKKKVGSNKALPPCEGEGECCEIF